ncbi:MAG: rhodanese-like domain-containing protein, partial [Caldimonas sp.]
MTNISTTLLSADQLRAWLESNESPPVVVEASFDLSDPARGEAEWRAGHLPGSLYLHLERDLCGQTTDANGAFKGRHPLPERAAFAATLGRCGITPASHVVALDRQGGMYAARLWWMLRWIGHAQAAVLDGGVAAWTAAGGALVKADTTVAAAPAYPEGHALADTTDVAALSAGLGRVYLL